MRSTIKKSLNIRLPIDLSVQIEVQAKSTGQTKTFLAMDALDTYTDQQFWQIAEVKAGIEEADRGEFANDAEMSAIFAKCAN